jgi:quinolinate synthase
MSPTSLDTRRAASVDRSIRLIASGASGGESCAPELADGPWTFDAGPASYGPGASMGDVIPTGSPRQGALPEA